MPLFRLPCHHLLVFLHLVPRWTSQVIHHCQWVNIYYCIRLLFYLHKANDQAHYLKPCTLGRFSLIPLFQQHTTVGQWRISNSFFACTNIPRQPIHESFLHGFFPLFSKLVRKTHMQPWMQGEGQRPCASGRRHRVLSYLCVWLISALWPFSCQFYLMKNCCWAHPT